MILQALASYYEREQKAPNSAIAPPGWIRRPIDYVIVLDQDGRCTLIESQFDVVKGGKLGHTRLLPAIGKQALKHTNSGQDANLLWDNASFALGRGHRGALKLRSFVAAIRLWFDGLNDAALRSVHEFLRSALAAPDSVREVLVAQRVIEDFEERDPVLAFRMSDDIDTLVHERAPIRAAYELRRLTRSSQVKQGRCLVSGLADVPLASHEMVIKGVWNAQPAGASIVSFNAPSFVSYGKEGRHAENAPISAASSFSYSTALNHLLSTDRQRIQVGDASTVFWADRDSAFEDLFAGLFGNHDDPTRGTAAVKALYESLRSGRLPAGERDARFFVLGMAPNAARIAVRFWVHAPVSELAPRIARHFDDLRVVRRYDGDPPTPSLFRLLTSLALRGKAENVPPRLAGEWMRSILEGRPYPAALLNAAVVRCKAERDVTYLRAALLKAWLNRDQRRRNPHLPDDHCEFKEALDMDQGDVPYRLGRLFAVLERIQQLAQPGINATIRDRYYGGASTTPVAVFTTLLRLKNAHLKKLTEPQVVHFERAIGDVLGTVADPRVGEFPRQLSLPEQGRFALGYYHQRQSFFTKKDGSDTPATEEA
ncbi:MAG: type I-C CRISPR-associated protein Cas8c/Csd1 [Burkholderiaceae bacterium]